MCAGRVRAPDNVRVAKGAKEFLRDRFFRTAGSCGDSMIGVGSHQIANPIPAESTNMVETFDIFLQEEDGSFKWIATTETFALARETVVQNPASSDFAFLIVNSNTGEKTLIEPPEGPPKPPA
jgi:hypothetical protein